jgi:hypothetical protein
MADHCLGLGLDILHEPIYFVLDILRLADEAVVPVVVLARYLGREVLIFLATTGFPFLIFPPTPIRDIFLLSLSLGRDIVTLELKVGAQCGESSIALLFQLIQAGVMLGGGEAGDGCMDGLECGVHLLHKLSDVHLGGELAGSWPQRKREGTRQMKAID